MTERSLDARHGYERLRRIHLETLKAALYEKYGVAEQEQRDVKTITLERLADCFKELQGIPRSAETVDDLSVLKNKRVLDLGCGSRRTSEDYRRSRCYEPWLCRGLLELGAYPVGIDINGNDNEAFESYQIDLSDPDALRDFVDASFDAVVSDSTFGMGEASSPLLLETLFRQGRFLPDFELDMYKTMQRLVRDPGVILTTMQSLIRYDGQDYESEDFQLALRKK